MYLQLYGLSGELTFRGVLMPDKAGMKVVRSALVGK